MPNLFFHNVETLLPGLEHYRPRNNVRIQFTLQMCMCACWKRSAHLECLCVRLSERTDVIVVNSLIPCIESLLIFRLSLRVRLQAAVVKDKRRPYLMQCGPGGCVPVLWIGYGRPRRLQRHPRWRVLVF